MLDGLIAMVVHKVAVGFEHIPHPFGDWRQPSASHAVVLTGQSADLLALLLFSVYVPDALAQFIVECVSLSLCAHDVTHGHRCDAHVAANVHHNNQREQYNCTGGAHRAGYRENTEYTIWARTHTRPLIHASVRVRALVPK